MQYLPYAEALNTLNKSFTISVSFVRPFQVSFRISSHADTCTDAALGLKKLQQQNGDEMTPIASVSSDSEIIMHREEIITLSAKVTCTEALGGELLLQKASLVLTPQVSAEEEAKGVQPENIELLDGDDEDAAGAGESAGAGAGTHVGNGVTHLQRSKRIVTYPTPLRRGEDYIGSVDLLCHPRPKRDMSRVSSQSNATMKLLFENFSEKISVPCHNREGIFGNDSSTKLATPRSLGHLLVEWKRAKDDLLAAPFLPRTSQMSVIAGKYTRVGPMSQQTPKGTSNSSPIKLLASQHAPYEMNTVSLLMPDDSESGVAPAGDAVMPAVSSTSSLASADAQGQGPGQGHRQGPISLAVTPSSSSNNLVEESAGDGDADPNAFDQSPLGDATDDAEAAELHLEAEAVFESALQLQLPTSRQSSPVLELLTPLAWLPKLGTAGVTDQATLLNMHFECSEICNGNITMPITHILDNPFQVFVTLPSRGRLGCQVNLNIQITSNLNTLEHVHLMVPLDIDGKIDLGADGTHDTRLSHTANNTSNTNSNSSRLFDSAFMISGPVLQTLVIAPGETLQIPILLIPLECGLLNVPNITLTWKKCSATILKLNKSIFVGPMDVCGGGGNVAAASSPSAYTSILA